MDGNNARRYDAPGTTGTTVNTPTDEAHKRGLVTGLVVGVIGGGIVGGIIGAMLDTNNPATTPQYQQSSTPNNNNRIYGTTPSDPNLDRPRTTNPSGNDPVPSGGNSGTGSTPR